jgi:hypothetical protein
MSKLQAAGGGLPALPSEEERMSIFWIIPLPFMP